MDIFICLPQTFNRNKSEFESVFVNKMTSALKKYYGPFTVELYYTLKTNMVEVYVMSSARYPGYDEKIKEEITNVVKEMISGNYPIEIKLNYSSLNPNFKPIVNNTYSAANSQFNVNRNIQNNNTNNPPSAVIDEFDYEKLSLNYHAEEPRYSFDQVVLSEKTRKEIERAIGVLEVERKVFDEWGLRSIIPNATSALSFYGPPGTGKTMAAEAVAKKMGRKILSATYADIESKFHGEGPKMVKAIFKAAERENAILFLDESDSLLSKRLTNVSDGSAQAINSMRSQLLISLERFKGIVIFATNLVVNYDKAFLSRLKNIEFSMPDKEEREKIWWNHLKTDKVRVPLGDDVDIDKIAQQYEFCGREIKNAVKDACVSAALEGHNIVTQKDLIEACETTKMESEKAITAEDHTNSHSVTTNNEQQNALKEALQRQIDKTAK